MDLHWGKCGTCNPLGCSVPHPIAPGNTYTAVLEQTSSLKLQQRDLRLEMRRKFLTRRVGEHWNRLPGEVVESPLSLEVFKSRLDRPLAGMG